LYSRLLIGQENALVVDCPSLLAGEVMYPEFYTLLSFVESVVLALTQTKLLISRFGRLSDLPFACFRAVVSLYVHASVD
jgi:hypothetical protein